MRARSCASVPYVFFISRPAAQHGEAHRLQSRYEIRRRGARLGPSWPTLGRAAFDICLDGLRARRTRRLACSERESGPSAGARVRSRRSSGICPRRTMRLALEPQPWSSAPPSVLANVTSRSRRASGPRWSARGAQPDRRQHHAAEQDRHHGLLAASPSQRLGKPPGLIEHDHRSRWLCAR